MINFLGNTARELTFEINRANITNQGLKVKAGMGELGGSEVDLARIFKEVRDSVRAMELRAASLKEQFDSLNLDVAAAMGIYAKQTVLIKQRNAEIKQKQKQIDYQTKGTAR